MKIYPDNKRAKKEDNSSITTYWFEKLAIAIAFISVFMFFVKLLFF
ncbi:MAG TPA: hypothetical protein VL098_05330 [Flavipsychrobacter sp.]|nr:hypothetical protein [Flavipsychrobacter sp.]